MIASTIEPELRSGFREPAKNGIGVYLVGERVHYCTGRVVPGNARQTGGFKWIDGEALGLEPGRHGLLWIGGKHYPHPQDYLRESERYGVRRRIQRPLSGLVFNETRVYLAHSMAMVRLVPRLHMPGIFGFFIVTGIDLVVGRTIPEKAQEMAAKIGPCARILSVADAAERQLHLFD